MFNKLRTRLKLYSLRAYVRKKLAYHEAGHLVFSYLLKIPCGSVAVDYDYENGIQFQDGSADVELRSRSQTIHFLPPDLERLLNMSQSGIGQVAAQCHLTTRETAQQYHKYFVILLAGRFSEERFQKDFLNENLEWLQKTYSRDLTEQNLNDDANRFNYLNTGLYYTIPERKVSFETSKAAILHYLSQKEVQQAVHRIAYKIKSNKKLSRSTIEELFSKIGFLKYCAQQYPILMNML